MGGPGSTPNWLAWQMSLAFDAPVLILDEAGSHQELLAMRGIYHRLYELQFTARGAMLA